MKSTSQLILLLALLIAGCSETAFDQDLEQDLEQDLTQEKPDPTKPAFTATINNKTWTASESLTDTTVADNNDSFYATFGSDSASFLILANGFYDGFETAQYAKILLWLREFDGAGRYELSINESSSLAVFSVVKSDGSFNQYYTSTTTFGVVNVSEYDKVNKTISGDFEFSAVSAVEGDSSIVVRNGKFSGVTIQ